MAISPIGFVDTNVIIRYMTQDQPVMAEAAKQLFEQAETGAVTITTCEAVIAEVVYILSSKSLYNVSRDEIKKHLRNFLRMKGLKIVNKSVYLQALDIYATTNLDFVDALGIEHTRHAKLTVLWTFDEGMHKVLSRMYPAMTPKAPSVQSDT
jgi:predicted nucleic acid-binding protein